MKVKPLHCEAAMQSSAAAGRAVRHPTPPYELLPGRWPRSPGQPILAPTHP
jgi:hypothetical protein